MSPMKNSPRTYWRSLEELAETEEFASVVEREVPRFRDVVNAFDRRRFLQLMAASMALGGLSGCGDGDPTRASFSPMSKQPENVVPGQRPLLSRPRRTTSGYATGVLLTASDGAAVQGRGQSGSSGQPGRRQRDHAGEHSRDVRSAPRPDDRRCRTRSPPGRLSSRHCIGRRKPLTGEATAGASACSRGATGSPTLAAQMDKMQQQFPEMRWHQWEPLHRDNELKAAKPASAAPPRGYSTSARPSASSVSAATSFRRARLARLRPRLRGDRRPSRNRRQDEPRLCDREHADPAGRQGRSPPGDAARRDRDGAALPRRGAAAPDRRNGRSRTLRMPRG